MHMYSWFNLLYTWTWGFPGAVSGTEPTCQCRRHKRCRSDPWVRKIPWKRAWQPPPVFWPGESHGLRSLSATVHGVAKSWTRLSDFHFTKERLGNGRSLLWGAPAPWLFSALKSLVGTVSRAVWVGSPLRIYTTSRRGKWKVSHLLSTAECERK